MQLTHVLYPVLYSCMAGFGLYPVFSVVANRLAGSKLTQLGNMALRKLGNMARAAGLQNLQVNTRGNFPLDIVFDSL